MAARSLRGLDWAARSGADQLHGNTLIVDAVFAGHQLQEAAGYMIDICVLQDLVAQAVAPLHNQRLDSPKLALELLGSEDAAPTSEALAFALWRRIVADLPPVERSQTHHLRVRQPPFLPFCLFAFLVWASRHPRARIP